MDEEAVILGRFFRISGFLGILLLASLGFYRLQHMIMILFLLTVKDTRFWGFPCLTFIYDQQLLHLGPPRPYIKEVPKTHFFDVEVSGVPEVVETVISSIL